MMVYKVNKSIDELEKKLDMIMNDMALRSDIQNLTNSMDRQYEIQKLIDKVHDD